MRLNVPYLHTAEKMASSRWEAKLQQAQMDENANNNNGNDETPLKRPSEKGDSPIAKRPRELFPEPDVQVISERGMLIMKYILGSSLLCA